jgi:drug/metabolite transporter (DMT)-like permease
LIKKGLLYFGAGQVGAMRIGITFLFLAPFALARYDRLSRKDWKYLLLVGLIGSGAPAFLFAAAQRGIDSSLAGILNSLTPLFTMLIGISFFSLKVRWFNVAGVIIALGGAAGLISVSGGHSFEFNIRYAIFVIIATICYATNVNLVKAHLTHLHPVTITVFSFAVIGLPVLVYLLFFTPIYPELANDPRNWEGVGYIAILAIVGTGLALIAFNKLIKMASPVFAASVTYMIPVVALLWGIIDGEEFQWHYAIWIILIILGVFLVNRKAIGSNRGAKEKKLDDKG